MNTMLNYFKKTESKPTVQGLTVFNYKQNQIRVVLIDGIPWWVLKDVCDILGIKNVSQMADRLDEDERSMFNIGRQGEVNIINESGLYKVILRSDKPEAKPFTRWVTHDVLPAIRKTGHYAVTDAESEVLTKADWLKISEYISNCSKHAFKALLVALSHLAPGEFDKANSEHERTEKVEFSYNIAQLLNEYMHENRLTQADLSKILNASRASVCGWVNGKVKPQGEYLHSVFNLLNVTKKGAINNVQRKFKTRNA